MKTPSEMIEELRKNPLYQRSLSQARTSEERKRIEDAVEGFVATMAVALAPVVHRMQGEGTATPGVTVVTSGSHATH